MAFLAEVPIWLAVGSKPSDDFITAGFKALDGPPADWFNYNWNRTSLAIQELQQKSGEIKTINNLSPDENGNIVVQTGGGTASTVSVVDAGDYYTGNNVEAVLQEIGKFDVGVRGSIITNMQALLGV